MNSLDAGFNWRETPFVRLLIWLVLGFGLGWMLPFPGFGSLSTMLATLAGAVILLAAAHRWGRNYGRRWWFGLVLALWLVGFGWWRVSSDLDLEAPTHFSRQIDALDTLSTTMLVRVLDRQLSGERLRLTGQVEALAGADSSGLPQPTPATGRLLVYLPFDARADSLYPGRRLWLSGRPQRLAPPLNPLAFDFSAYQARRNCYYQLRVGDAANWRAIPGTEGSLAGLALRLRARWLRVFREHLTTPNELAVGAALTLGYRDELQPELRNAYAQTGAVHVLAVSGLHVGIIAWGLQWLLGWLPIRRKKWGKVVMLALNLLGIWGFALLTGLSPSVQRAALMFSLLLVGQALQRRHQVYNSLAASAFLLLLTNPWLLLDVGFQLSYLAVAGIVFFQPRIYRLWYVPQPALNYVWNLTAVAIAAQLTTFPLSIYYFHQFPVYFWLSGLVVVPAAPFILGLGLLLLAVGQAPWLGWVLGKIWYALIWVVNALIFAMSKLPGALVEGIWVSGLAVGMLFVAVFALAQWWRAGRASWGLTCLAALACTLALGAASVWQRVSQPTWVVYHLPRATVVDWFAGRTRYTWTSLPPDAPALGFATTNFRSYQGATSALELAASAADTSVAGRYWRYDAGQVAFLDHRLSILDTPPDPRQPPPAQPWRTDVLLLCGNPRVKLEDLAVHYTFDQLVIDGSNSRYRTAQWLQQCAELGWRCHATAQDGAWVWTPPFEK